MKRIPFGNLPDGRIAELCVLADPRAEAAVSTLGATLVSVRTPDRNGSWADIALGFDAAADYLSRPGCLGATVGRYAGRIANGRFPLNGRTVELVKNRPPHTIHGGPEGFHRQLWTVVHQTDTRLELCLTSHAGDQGFPGTLTALAAFSLQDDTLTLEIRARSDDDTVCSITNHVYWNLSGHDSGAIDRHILTVQAETYLETDRDTIPTGGILPVEGTPQDLRRPVPLKGRELDHTLLLSGPEGLKPAGRLADPVSGRWLRASTDLPALQVYTGDHLPPALPGKGGALYGPRSGLCLEAQFCPDAPNHPNFPSALLPAGTETIHTISWEFGVEAAEQLKEETAYD